MILADFNITPFFPQAGLTYVFDWFTLAYAIILLISILLGIKNGFMKTLINALGGIIVVVLAFLLAKPIGNLLYRDLNWGAALCGKCTSWIASKGPDMETAIAVSEAETALTTGLSNAKLPVILIPTIIKLALPFVPAEGTFTVASVLGNAMANYIFIVAAFIVLVIVLTIVLIIVKHLLKALTEIKLINVIDRILGAVGGLVVGIVIICTISYGASLLISIPQCTDAITGLLFLNDDNVWTFSKAVYNYNLIGKLFELYL